MRTTRTRSGRDKPLTERRTHLDSLQQGDARTGGPQYRDLDVVGGLKINGGQASRRAVT